MSRRKPLPLESPHWQPILEALKHRSQQTNSDTLAALDFNQALKADRLRSSARWADGRRELLPASAWNDLYVDMWFTAGYRPQDPTPLRSGMSVFSRKLGGQPRGVWFYVWGPDYRKVFRPVAAPSKPSRPTPAELAALKQLPGELAAALKPPLEADDAPDKGKGEAPRKSSKGKKREPRDQWQITEALLRADYPQGCVPDTVSNANLRRKILGSESKRWKAECERRGISVPAPSPSTVDRVRKSLIP